MSVVQSHESFLVQGLEWQEVKTVFEVRTRRCEEGPPLASAQQGNSMGLARERGKEKGEYH